MFNKNVDDNQRMYNDNRFTAFLKKFLIALVDFCLFGVTNMAICYITNNGHIVTSSYRNLAFSYFHFFLVGILAVLINMVMDLYKGVWRYAGNDELVRSVASAAMQSAMLFFVDRVLFRHIFKVSGRLAWYAYVLCFIFLCFCLVVPRFGFRILKRFTQNVFEKTGKSGRVMIVGAGFMGNFVIDALANDHYVAGRPVIAVDDNPEKYRKSINGVKIVGNCSQIPQLAEKYRIDQIIICLPSASPKRQKEIIDLAMETRAKVRISPSLNDMIEGGNRKIRSIDIADLLSRPEISLDKKVCRYLVGKNILVTGGGGSIGSEICKQVARYHPNLIVIFDIYENCAFELANELKDKYNGEMDIQVRIGSVRDIDRLREIFEQFKPDVIFHAAAHKHVPLMEDSPCEAVKNNVFGTYNVAMLADEYKVPKMVILSTDKAVNPTNVMGCTKRITEIIVQEMNARSQNTHYAAVRFGNVLGSHGSVIPIFKKQIEKGGPVKVTHPDITRYFMTIPEAAQLVCQAGGLAEGGEIFVLDMGEPVKIMDLAKNLIKLSGYSVEEIGIEIVGLRPGEKLYEELAMNSEIATRVKTANEKIFVNQPLDIDESKFENMMNELKDINDDNVREVLKKHIKSYHPSEC